MNDLLVYTAVFGGRDAIHIPRAVGFDWVCFSDTRLLAGKPGVTYTRMPIPGDPVRSARMMKLKPHLMFPEYKRWIWIDGNVVIPKGVTSEQLQQIQGPIAVLTNAGRSCIYDAAQDCIESGLDDKRTVTGQMLRYHDQGYPAGIGLADTSVLIRDNTPEIASFNDFWWNEISEGSHRDQLSFNYAAWCVKAQVKYMSVMARSPHFKKVEHASVGGPHGT